MDILVTIIEFLCFLSQESPTLVIEKLFANKINKILNEILFNLNYGNPENPQGQVMQ